MVEEDLGNQITGQHGHLILCACLPQVIQQPGQAGRMVEGDVGTTLRVAFQLEGYLSDTVSVPADTLGGSQVDFTLPPPLQTAPKGSVYTGGYTEPVRRR